MSALTSACVKVCIAGGSLAQNVESAISGSVMSGISCFTQPIPASSSISAMYPLATATTACVPALGPLDPPPQSVVICIYGGCAVVGRRVDSWLCNRRSLEWRPAVFLWLTPTSLSSEVCRSALWGCDRGDLRTPRRVYGACHTSVLLTCRLLECKCDA